MKDIKEDINNMNNRIDEAEMRIAEAEKRPQGVEGAIMELLKRQTRLEARLTDQEGRARRDNIRIHGVSEGAEENSTRNILCRNVTERKPGPSALHRSVH